MVPDVVPAGEGVRVKPCAAKNGDPTHQDVIPVLGALLRSGNAGTGKKVSTGETQHRVSMTAKGRAIKLDAGMQHLTPGGFVT